MEDTTGTAAWTKREGIAAEEEKTTLNRRTKAAKQYLQKDLEGTVAKGATTDMGLSEIGPISLSPQEKQRSKKGACLLGPRKPKRDGASSSALKKPKKGREAHQTLALPPDARKRQQLKNLRRGSNVFDEKDRQGNCQPEMACGGCLIGARGGGGGWGEAVGWPTDFGRICQFWWWRQLISRVRQRRTSCSAAANSAKWLVLGFLFPRSH
ncbi:hypothetical protein Ancab_018053 [Ancistrocladus abbreviatus]